MLVVKQEVQMLVTTVRAPLLCYFLKYRNIPITLDETCITALVTGVNVIK